MSYFYSISVELVTSILPASFSFKHGEYRKILNEKLAIVNDRSKLTSNPKHIQINDSSTSDRILSILLESQQELEYPGRSLKGLSNFLAKDPLFSNLISSSGKLLKSIASKKEYFEAKREHGDLSDPEMMKLLTLLILRRDTNDLEIIKAIKSVLSKTNLEIKERSDLDV